LNLQLQFILGLKLNKTQINYNQQLKAGIKKN